MIDMKRLRELYEAHGTSFIPCDTLTLKVAQAIWREAQSEERERCAKWVSCYNGCDHIADEIREGANHAE